MTVFVLQSGAALTSTSLVTTQATSAKTITTPATASAPPLQILHTLPSAQAKVAQAGVKVTGGQIKVTSASSTVVAGSGAGARVLTQRPGGGLVVTQIPQAAGAGKTGNLMTLLHPCHIYSWFRNPMIFVISDRSQRHDLRLTLGNKLI